MRDLPWTLLLSWFPKKHVSTYSCHSSICVLHPNLDIGVLGMFLRSLNSFWLFSRSFKRAPWAPPPVSVSSQEMMDEKELSATAIKSIAEAPHRGLEEYLEESFGFMGRTLNAVTALGPGCFR